MRSLSVFAGAAVLCAALGQAFAASSGASVDLFGTPGIKLRLSPKGAVPVVVDFERLKHLAPHAPLRVVLPEGEYQAVFDGVQAYAAGVDEWRAHLVVDSDKRVLLIAAPDGITGYVRTPLQNWKLTAIAGANYLIADGSGPPPRVAQAATPQLLAAAAIAGKGAARPVMPDAPPGIQAYPADVDLVALASLAPGSEADLTLPNAGTYKVAYQDSVANEDGTTTWVGHLRDYGDDFRVILTYGPEGTEGHILTPYGEFLIGSAGGRQWIVDVARSGLQPPPASGSDAVGAPPHSPAAAKVAAATAVSGTATAAADAHPEPQSLAAAGFLFRPSPTPTPKPTPKPIPTPTPKPTPAPTPAPTPKPVAAATVNSTIDVLVLYTDGFKARLGSAATTRIAALVALANQAYKDSGVAITLRLVGTVQVAYTDTNSDTLALDDLTAGAGTLANVGSLRAEFGADLVTMLRPLHTKARMTCGLGWVGGYGGASISWFASNGYSVVGDGTDMDGRDYYCNDYSFAHELGHNMGSMHDRATVASQGGGTGAYPYAFGYGRSGAFGTVMSYISPVVGKFSNPSLKTCAGQACGVAETDTRNSANNVLSLNNTRVAVAGFMPTAVPPAIAITGVVSSASGQPLAGVKLTGTGAACTASGANGAYSCTVAPGWSGSVTPALAGYTFAPAALAYATIAAGSAGQNFKATAAAPATAARK